MQFRPEIDFLRGIAVLSVVFFHAKFSFMVNGFLGVDIFFVLSGYLIGGKLIASLHQGTFNYIEFIHSRILRLFPAMLFVCAVSVLFASFLFSSQTLEELAKESLYAIFSLTNVLYYFTFDYFAGETLRKPVLHTWSLSVEEQFYLLYPWIILLAIRFRMLTISVVILFIVSFTTYIFISQSDKLAAFYLTPFRVWQFAAGTIAYLIFTKNIQILNSFKIQLIILIISTFGIIISFLNGFEFSPYAPLYVLTLTISVATILATFRIDPIRQIFKFGAVSLLARSSYSIYLVHWPVTVFVAYYSNYELSSLVSVMIVILSLVLGWVLYATVETKFYYRNNNKQNNLSLPLAIAAMITVFFSAHVWKDASFANKFGNQNIKRLLSQATSAKKDRRRYINSRLSQRRVNSKTKILVVGDSLADDIEIALSHGFPNKKISKFVKNGCRPLVGYTSPRWTDGQRKRCPEFGKKILNVVKNNQQIETIVIAANWGNNQTELLKNTINEIRKHSVNIILFGPRITYELDAAQILERSKSLNDVKTKHIAAANTEKYLAINNQMKNIPNVRYVDMKHFQCPGKIQCSNLTANGRQLIVYDKSHFTTRSSELMGQWLKKTLNFN